LYEGCNYSNTYFERHATLPVAKRWRAWYQGEKARESGRAWMINSGARGSPTAEMTRPTTRVMVTLGGRNRAASTQNTREEGQREQALEPRSDVPARLTFRVNARSRAAEEENQGRSSTECLFSRAPLPSHRQAGTAPTPCLPVGCNGSPGCWCVRLQLM